MKLRLLIGFCLGVVANSVGLLGAQTLEITPARVMVDETAAIRVTGIGPQKHVTIDAALTDGAGASWASTAEFVADESGVVDVAKQAPVKGAYHGVSPMGLIWSMMPAAKDVHVYQPPREFGVETIRLQVMTDGKQIASGQLEQMAIREGVRQIKLKGALHGVFFIPEGTGQHPGVMVVGGSEGGLPQRKAAWLASHGYAALALAYFHYEDLPRSLENIPLEYFGEALSWMMQRPEVAPGQIAVMGTSRGGELALQLGSMYPQIHAVVAYVPANVRYAACCGRTMGAAWTWKGQALAYVVPRMRQQDFQRDAAAAIPVEQTHGPILVLSGESDGVWESQAMTDAVMHRLKQANFAYRYERLNYPHAGHRVGAPGIMPAWTGGVSHPISGESMNFGGTTQGNAESSLDATPKVLEFLQQSFAQNGSR